MKTIKKLLVKVWDAEEMRPTGIEYFLEGTPLAHLIEWKHPLIALTYGTGTDAPEPGSVPTEFKIGKLMYWAGVIGDTHAKEGRLLLSEKNDSLRLMAKYPGFFQYAEDTVRQGRAWLANGANYGSTEGTFKVLVVEAGTEIEGILYEDGSMSVAEDLITGGKARPIELGATANNFSIFQGLDYDEIKDDAKACAKNLRHDVRNMDMKTLFHLKTEGFGMDNALKDRFLLVCPLLARHPWFNNSISDVAARWMSSHAFAPYLTMKCYMAIASKFWTLPVGHSLAYRHPKIAGAGLQALDIKKARTIPDFIVGGGVWTFTGNHSAGEGVTIKGAGCILPRSKMGNFDIITCDKNIKIGKRIGYLETCFTGVLVTLLRYAKSCLLGVPYKDGKLMNLDYDGDLINIVKADNYPQIWANARKHQGDSASFKFPKSSKTDWSQENALRVLLNAMHSSMGGSTNMNSWWLSMNLKERRALLPKLWPSTLALLGKMNPELEEKDMPEMSLQAVDAIFQYHVQYHVDAIKNLKCDTYVVQTTEARIISILSAATDKIPGYLTHKRAMKAGVAFETAFPEFLDDMDPIIREKMKSDSIAKRSYEWRMQIPNTIHGTPVMFFRLNREPLEWMFEALLNRDNKTIDTRLFSTWAPVVTNKDMQYADLLVNEFREHVIRFERMRTKGIVSMGNPDDVNIYREQWRDICQDFTNTYFNGNRVRAMHALWRASQDTNERLVSGCVFIGFSDEVENMLKSNAGTLMATRCIVVGVKALMPKLPERIEDDCEIIYDGAVARLNINVPGNKERLFGYVANPSARELREGYSIPGEGMYHVVLTIRPSGSAYLAVFEPI